jgi:hypothetical protein
LVPNPRNTHESHEKTRAARVDSTKDRSARL